MRISVVIASHGDDRWRDLAYSRAYPSAVESGADEVLIEHDPEADWRADVRNRLVAQIDDWNFDSWVVTLDADDELASGFCEALRKCEGPTLACSDGYQLMTLHGQELDARDFVPLAAADGRFVTISRPGHNFENKALLTPAIQYVRKGRASEPRFWPECDLSDHNWMVCGTAFPKALFDAVGGWRTMRGTGTYNEWDDWELWIRMRKAGAVTVKVPDAVYVAHVNAKSAAQRSSGPQRSAWLKEVRDLHFKEEAA